MIAAEVDTVSQLFRMRVERSGARECYRTKMDGRWHPVSWSQFASAVDAAAAGLSALGVGPGDAVAILGETCPDWCVADLGAILCGARSVGLYPTLLEDQIRYILEDSGARVLFAQGAEQYERLRPLLDDVDGLEHIVVWDHDPAEGGSVHTLAALGALGRSEGAEFVDAAVGPQDVALVVYTSGTTGQPKGVPLTHGNIVSQLASGADLLPEPITDEDITLAFLPMCHVAEHVPGFFGRINLGLRAAYATSIETVLDEVQEIRPTYFGAVPRIFEKMYGRIRERVAQANPRRQAIFRWAERQARRYARAQTAGPPMNARERMAYALADRLVFRKMRAVFGGRVKTFVTGAAPINIEILEFFYGVGMTILEVYGLSETTAISFANLPGDVRLGTVGRALPGLEYRIASDGEILMKGPGVFSGYLNRPEANAEAFDSDGFFCTGDIGEVDADGFLRITDRKKNLIKTAGGKYVAPARLEALVKEEPLVSQVYVHGDQRPYVVALITLDERETGRVAEDLGVDEAGLFENPEVNRRVQVAVDGANKRLARYEQIKDHAILCRDFSIEADTLTPTMKLKRREVASQHAAEIDALYAAR